MKQIKRNKIWVVVLLCLPQFLMGQITFPKDEPEYNKPQVYVFVNAMIHVNSSKTIENGSLLVANEKIVEVGKNVTQPRNAIVIDLKGKHIYPSFIDIYTSFGMPEVKQGAFSFMPQNESAKQGAYNWNETIHPETDAAGLYKQNSNGAKDYRRVGIGTVVGHYADGLMRGIGCAIALNDEKEVKSLLHPKTVDFYSLFKGVSQQSYPTSLMGCIALLRQTFYDAVWYETGGNTKETNLSLEALVKNKNLRHIVEANDKYNILRAHKIANEFGLKFIYKTGGNEYQCIDEIKKINAPLIVPVNFPVAFDVEDYYDAKNVSLAELKHWEMAPGNPYALYKNGISFCFTTDGLKDKGAFLNNIRKAIAYGLPANEALKALTETPAALAGLSDLVGTLDKNKLASFIITNKDIFEEKCIIHEHWVNGSRFELSSMNKVDIRGEYSLNINQKNVQLFVRGDFENPQAEIKSDTVKIPAMVKREINTIALSFLGKSGVFEGPTRLAGTLNFDSGSWDGTGQLSDGTVVIWTAIRKEKFKEVAKKKQAADSVNIGQLTFPNMAYGFDTLPKQELVWIKNATIWTNEQEGVLKNADIILKDGKILHVGKNLTKPAGKVVEIDGTGMHVTPGIIDEHSHIAISQGVNEHGQNNSAEVSIGDVVDADDINIYRQLSGGVTTSQLLHGSANPIGGQSAIIKLRWGSLPEEMKIKGADGFIKFALGENVKQSNQSFFNNRYPQTRMGVEQVFYEAFHKALAYENEWKTFTTALTKVKIKPQAPRKNLECEVMLEILRSKRFITCHSYVQSEINMLMHVADSMGFKVNTFTHILEGYKIADKMAKHGVSASSFSDWWAYKFEVYEAIPYNAAIMTRQGVNVGINSDDAEMARRLNQEAAKSVKYGGLTEEEALKLVTLNPAKMLHLDKQLGSLKVGKDADVVIWTDNPLSIYAKVEKTYVDGALYFDRSNDSTVRNQNRIKRMRIIKKMMEAKANGEEVVKPTKKVKKMYHCDTLENIVEEEVNK